MALINQLQRLPSHTPGGGAAAAQHDWDPGQAQRESTIEDCCIEPPCSTAAAAVIASVVGSKCST